MEDLWIGKIKPSYLQGKHNAQGKQSDELVRGILRNDLAKLKDAGVHPYDINRFLSAASLFVPVLLDSIPRPSGLNALEIGSGIGMKSLPFSRLFYSYTGVEIDAMQVARAQRLQRACGDEKIKYVQANAEEVASDPGLFGVPDKIDVLILYAVLEHLTPNERDSVFSIMRSVHASGGYVLVAETPNRLIPFDSHTSQLHFFNMLPDDVAVRYASRSPREGFRKAIENCGDRDAEVSLYRQGRGMSYHDFELSFLDHVGPASFSLGGYDSRLLTMEPVAAGEINLLKYFFANDLFVDPLFSRYWINFIASPPRDALSENLTISDPMPEGRPNATGGNRGPWSKTWAIADVPESLVRFPIRRMNEPTRITFSVDTAKSEGAFVVQDERGECLRAVSVSALRECIPQRWHSSVSFDVDLDHAEGDVFMRPAGRADKVAVTTAFVHGRK